MLDLNLLQSWNIEQMKNQNELDSIINTIQNSYKIC